MPVRGPNYDSLSCIVLFWKWANSESTSDLAPPYSIEQILENWRRDTASGVSERRPIEVPLTDYFIALCSKVTGVAISACTWVVGQLQPGYLERLSYVCGLIRDPTFDTVRRLRAAFRTDRLSVAELHGRIYAHYVQWHQTQSARSAFFRHMEFPEKQTLRQAFDFRDVTQSEQAKVLAFYKFAVLVAELERLAARVEVLCTFGPAGHGKSTVMDGLFQVKSAAISPANNVRGPRVVGVFLADSWQEEPRDVIIVDLPPASKGDVLQRLILESAALVLVVTHCVLWETDSCPFEELDIATNAETLGEVVQLHRRRVGDASEFTFTWANIDYATCHMTSVAASELIERLSREPIHMHTLSRCATMGTTTTFRAVNHTAGNVHASPVVLAQSEPDGAAVASPSVTVHTAHVMDGGCALTVVPMTWSKAIEVWDNVVVKCGGEMPDDPRWSFVANAPSDKPPLVCSLEAATRTASARG
jgi:hypothetical protein